MNTVFNILDYGAVGDGTQDCTVAIQAAMDAASACQGEIIVPPGRYSVGHLHLHGQGVSLRGTPAWSYRSPGASTLVLNDPDAECMIDITGAFGCSIHGISMTGMDIGDHPINGINLYWPEYNGGSEEDTPTIDECRISNFTGDAIHLEHIWCFSVRHCMLGYNGGNGLFIDGWDGFVLDNWFSYNKGYGIKGGNVVASITATGNRVEWNQAGGFRIPFGDSCNFTGNFFDRGHGPAIDLGSDKGVSLITITGNIFRRSGACEVGEHRAPEDSCHVRLLNCSNLTVTGNTMRVGRNDGGGGILSPDYGMIINGCHECIVKNNTLMTAALKDLIIEGSNTNCIIEDNLGTLADENTTTGSPLLN